MQKDSKLFDDIAKMASGAAGELLEMKREMDAVLAGKLERLIQKMNLATREEHETLLQMMSKIRSQQEEFAKRLDALERKVQPTEK